MAQYKTQDAFAGYDGVYKIDGKCVSATNDNVARSESEVSALPAWSEGTKYDTCEECQDSSDPSTSTPSASSASPSSPSASSASSPSSPSSSPSSSASAACECAGYSVGDIITTSGVYDNLCYEYEIMFFGGTQAWDDHFTSGGNGCIEYPEGSGQIVAEAYLENTGNMAGTAGNPITMVCGTWDNCDTSSASSSASSPSASSASSPSASSASSPSASGSSSPSSPSASGSSSPSSPSASGSSSPSSSDSFSPSSCSTPSDVNERYWHYPAPTLCDGSSLPTSDPYASGFITLGPIGIMAGTNSSAGYNGMCVKLDTGSAEILECGEYQTLKNQGIPDGGPTDFEYDSANDSCECCRRANTCPECDDCQPTFTSMGIPVGNVCPSPAYNGGTTYNYGAEVWTECTGSGTSVYKKWALTNCNTQVCSSAGVDPCDTGNSLHKWTLLGTCKHDSQCGTDNNTYFE